MCLCVQVQHGYGSVDLQMRMPLHQKQRLRFYTRACILDQFKDEHSFYTKSKSLRCTQEYVLAHSSLHIAHAHAHSCKSRCVLKQPHKHPCKLSKTLLYLSIYPSF